MKNKLIVYSIGTLLLLNIIAWQEVFDLAKPDSLRVDFLDVGQGDSIFINTPDSHQILIDGGPSSVVLEKLSGRMSFSDRTIDLVVLTHPDRDHVQGLIEVMERYKVEYILWTGAIKDSPEYSKWIESLEKEKKEGSKVVIANCDKSIRLGDVLIEIISPVDDLNGKVIGKTSNDSSIVSRFSFYNTSFLFAGDLSSNGEKKILNSNLDSDVLKIGHHGSKYSTSDIFLERVSPEYAVISVGKDNSYGHPALEVLQRLKNFGIDILRTDTNGDIQMVSDGNNIKIY